MSEQGSCRYCGEQLVGPTKGGGFFAPDRRVSLTSVDGTTCNDRECLNAASQVTQHQPELLS